MSILIVEDDTGLREALRRSAEFSFDEIYEASTAYEAFLIIDGKKPRIVVSDWDLRGKLSGVDVANYATQNASSTKIVLITGKSMNQLKKLTSHLNIDSYIAKPFSLFEFRSILEQINSSL